MGAVNALGRSWRWVAVSRGTRREWQAEDVIVGIGVDVVAISRLREALERTPALAARLFTESERGRPLSSLAGCFAVKEAVAKALGAPTGLRWTDVEVAHDPSGRPFLRASGSVAQAADRQGIGNWHVSLSHDGGVSVAMVVAEE